MFLGWTLGDFSAFCVVECQSKGTWLRMKNPALIERGSSSIVKPTYFPFHLVGEKWGSKNRRNIFKFLPGNINDTYETSSKSDLFDLVVTEISARVEITIQSLSAAGYRAYNWTARDVLSDRSQATNDVISVGDLWCSVPSWKIYENILPTQELVQGSWLLFFHIFYLKLPTNSTNCRNEQLWRKKFLLPMPIS